MCVIIQAVKESDPRGAPHPSIRNQVTKTHCLPFAPGVLWAGTTNFLWFALNHHHIASSMRAQNCPTKFEPDALLGPQVVLIVVIFAESV